MQTPLHTPLLSAKTIPQRNANAHVHVVSANSTHRGRFLFPYTFALTGFGRRRISCPPQQLACIERAPSYKIPVPATENPVPATQDRAFFDVAHNRH